LPEDAFELVGHMRRFPRYSNKRVIDPQIQMFADQVGLKLPTNWGLPMPNEEASYKSLGKYNKLVPFMEPKDVEDMNKAWEMVDQHFSPYMRDSEVRSVDEVIKDLDKNTSCGAPFTQKYTTKKDLFTNCDGILDWLEADWDRLVEDDWTCVATNSLKEEVRAQEKILENSIRTFTAMPVDATVHGNRLFADMNEKMYAAHLVSASYVGASNVKGTWGRLYDKLNVFPNGYALDESQYDSSLRAYMMWGCAEFRFRMLRNEDRTAENKRRIIVYYRNLINTLVLTAEGVIVMKKGGNPSGSVNTISDNTLILYALMSYAWVKLAPLGADDIENFELHTAKALNGDDNTWTVSNAAHTFYNGRSVIDVWKTIGVITTTDSLEPRKAADLDFLSAHTIFLDGCPVPLYDRTKLMTSLLYAPSAHLTPETSLNRAAALLLNGWTDPVFRTFCRDFINWLLKEYDSVLFSDDRWIMAKCSVLSDSRLYELYTGRKQHEILDSQSIELFPQSITTYQEHEERLNQPDKSCLSMPQTNGKKKSGQVRRNRKPKKSVVVIRTAGRAGLPNAGVMLGPRPKPGFSRRRQLAGVGQTRNASAPMGRRTATFTEDEYIAEVIGPSTGANFNVTSYAVNPGNTTTFPWLSSIAKQFEKYHFNFLEFYYKREVSEFATAGTTGKVIMSFDADASDAPPASKKQMEDTDPHMDDMPCKNMKLVVPKQILKRMNDGFYVRPGGLPGGSDIKTYDIGNLFIATQALAANTATVGELHVRYSVTLFIPVLESITTAPANNQVSQLISGAGEALTTSVLYTLLLADTTAADGYNNGLGVTNVNGVITPAAGNYIVTGTILSVNTGTSTVFDMFIYKNSTAITVFSPSIAIVAQTSGDQTLTQSVFVSCNGTDTLTLRADNAFSSGTSTVYGSMLIQAI